jgi:CheY-like chemotaxis protein
MVIDDEETIARGVHRQLAGDHEVVALTSPNEALRRVRAGERYDAIVCDLIVPELTGMEVFAQLDTEAPDQARRMIFMTGGAFTERARQFLAENATRCLDKPLDRVQLTTAICRLVDGAPQGGSVAT